MEHTKVTDKLDKTAAIKRCAERPLLSGADIRRPPNQDRILIEIAPTADWQVSDDKLAKAVAAIDWRRESAPDQSRSFISCR